MSVVAGLGRPRIASGEKAPVAGKHALQREPVATRTKTASKRGLGRVKNVVAASKHGIGRMVDAVAPEIDLHSIVKVTAFVGGVVACAALNTLHMAENEGQVNGEPVRATMMFGDNDSMVLSNGSRIIIPDLWHGKHGEGVYFTSENTGADREILNALAPLDDSVDQQLSKPDVIRLRQLKTDLNKTMAPLSQEYDSNFGLSLLEVGGLSLAAVGAVGAIRRSWRHEGQWGDNFAMVALAPLAIAGLSSVVSHGVNVYENSQTSNITTINPIDMPAGIMVFSEVRTPSGIIFSARSH